MPRHKDAPRTLLEAVRYFADQDVALAFVASLRWPDGPACPHCGGADPMFLQTRRIWKCRACRRQFSVKAGTIFEDSPISLSKWLPAMWMLANCRNGISSYELARALGVTQKTAWFMLHRIRLAMQQSGGFDKFNGDVEVDETYIGGKARNMHASRKARVVKKRGRGANGKIAVLGLLERHGPDKSQSTIRVKRIDSLRMRAMHAHIAEAVEPGATVHTDAYYSYHGLDANYVHKVIDHAECYAVDNVHTNGLENFWSLLKRAVKGTYVSVEPFHLFRYLDEQAFRFNNRKDTDRSRFMRAVASIINKRLTYSSLVGQEMATT